MRCSPEHDLQAQIATWAAMMGRTLHPELSLLFSIDHAGTRHISHAKALKARGVKAGIPDMFLPVAKAGFHGCWVELKTARGRLSEAQKAWRNQLTAHGYQYLLVRTFDAATDAITRYLCEELP